MVIPGDAVRLEGPPDRRPRQLHLGARLPTSSALDIAPLSTHASTRPGEDRSSTLHDFNERCATRRLSSNRIHRERRAWRSSSIAAFELGRPVDNATIALTKLDSRVDWPADHRPRRRDSRSSKAIRPGAALWPRRPPRRPTRVANWPPTSPSTTTPPPNSSCWPAISMRPAELLGRPGRAARLRAGTWPAKVAWPTPVATSPVRSRSYERPWPPCRGRTTWRSWATCTRCPAISRRHEQYAHGRVHRVACTATGSGRLRPRVQPVPVRSRMATLTGADARPDGARNRKDIYGYDTYAWALHAAGRDAEALGAMSQAMAWARPTPSC